MMSNKMKIVILIIAVVFLVVFIVNLISGDENTEENNLQATAIDETQIQYDEENEEYYVTDEEGNITHTSENKSDLEIYTIDPDYESWDPDESDDIEESTEIIDDN